MASLIIGAGIFGYMQVKERKAKKQEKARKVEEAREAELQAQLRSSDEYSFGTGNETRNQSQDYAELPAYSERLPRRSSSIYSQNSDTETRNNQDVKV